MDKTLYEISEAFEGIMETLDMITDPDADDEIGEGLEDAMNEALNSLEMDLATKTENIVRLLASWDAMGVMVKSEEERLRQKRKVLEAKTVRLRTYLRDQMVRTGRKKIETSVKNVTLRAGSKRVVIDDEELLPQGTFDTVYTIKPDKKLIMERFKAGMETEGAHIEEGEPTLMIR